MKTTLRKATKQDLQSVLDLVKELALYEKAPQEVTVTLADYETDFENKVFDIFLAEQENEIVGIAFYYMAYSTWKGKMPVSYTHLLYVTIKDDLSFIINCSSLQNTFDSFEEEFSSIVNSFTISQLQ